MARTDITGPYRKNINNLIVNGDFEYAPPFTAGNNTNQTWIDGTTGTSLSPRTWGWCFKKDIPAASGKFDSSISKTGKYSLKLSLLATGGGARAESFRSTSALTAEGFIPALPSTSYTFSGWIKTEKSSGDGTGASLSIREYSTSNVATVTNTSTIINTTQDWTWVTKTFTTAASTRFLAPLCAIVGTGSTADLIMDAWFDDIVLTRTTLQARTAVTTPRRTIKDNRYSVRWPTLGSGRGLATASNKVAELGVTNLNYSAGIWVKESSRRAIFGNIIFILKTNSPYIYAFQIRSNGSGTFGLAFYDGTLNPILNSPSSYSVGSWYHVAFTKQDKIVKLYVNGLLVNTGSITVGSTLSDAIEISSTGAAFAGNVSKAFIYGRVLTAAEISNIYSDDVYPDGALFNAPLNEGKGTIAYDTVNNNNITLTTPTWSTDTVTGIRRQDKLLQNGDFEFAPAFTAPTTGSSRWIDGTAGGSTSISQYGWGMIKTGTASAQFDTTVKQSGTTSLKLSTASVSSYIEADVYNTLAIGEPKSYLIPALQSTSYTLSFYMKTEYISGDSSQGATVGLPELNGVLAIIRDNTGTGAVLKTTTGWTYYSFSVTTQSTTRFLNVQPRIFGHTGAATLQMNAWFDDITLVKN